MPGKAFKFFRTLGKITVFLSPIVIIALVSYVFLKDLILSPVDPAVTETELFELAPGTSFRQAAKLLEEKGLVKRWWSLDIISRIKGNNVIGAGEYELSKSMTPEQILTTLLEGKVFKRKVVLKEGQVVADLADIVEKAGLLARKQMVEALVDPSLISRAGLVSKGFEGYLFPDTYLFSRPITADEIIWTMLKEGEKRWKPEYEERAASLGWNRHQVLTLASVIEKESGNAEEQPSISSVFHNRLAADWMLQSDPTAVYGLPGFTGPILRKHLEIDSPYNTYKYRGLPPGPICNPGDSAIKAALYPADTTYMYFVADGDGGHIFSSTQKEHERAVEFYRRAREIQEEARKGSEEPVVEEMPAPVEPPAPVAQ